MDALTTSESEVDWPTDEGIWMGYVSKTSGWFPFRTMALRDDLPSAEQLEAERLDPVNVPPRAILMIVAQFPQSQDRWPYTVQGCHPATKWRRPNDEEKQKALHFYGMEK